MNIEQALEKLKSENITSSVQMLRRWIRQGKIKATLHSKKEGYTVDRQSLMDFIEKKRINKVTSNVNEEEIEEIKQKAYDAGWNDREKLVKYVIHEREKELIQKGAYEQELVLYHSDLKKSKLYKRCLENHLKSLELSKITVRILGTWALVVELAYYIDINLLPHENRRLETRLRDDIIKTMFLAIETDGDAYELYEGLWMSKI